MADPQHGQEGRKQQDRQQQAARRRLPVLQRDFFPAYVVWELTLACDHACRHCGSRAVNARDSELDTTQALAVVAQLAALRAREVVLIGGEAYLHDAFLTVIAALRAAGIVVIMTTGGAGITAALARDMAAREWRGCRSASMASPTRTTRSGPNAGRSRRRRRRWGI